MKAKENLTTLEVWGGEALFNYSMTQNVDSEHMTEELFYCGGILNSTSDANGHPIEIHGYRFSHCEVMENGCLNAICYDDDENQYRFLIEENGVYEVKND